MHYSQTCSEDQFCKTTNHIRQPMLFFCCCCPLGINPYNFVKNHPILKNKGSFYAKFCWKIFHVAKKVALRVWGLRTSFGTIGPNRLIKPEVLNLGSNFCKQGLILCRILSRIKCFT